MKLRIKCKKSAHDKFDCAFFQNGSDRCIKGRVPATCNTILQPDPKSTKGIEAQKVRDFYNKAVC